MKVEQLPWALGIAAELRAEVDSLNAAESLRIPLEPGGWWHQYVCETHHTELLFDEMEADAEAYRCPHGCLAQRAAYRGAWLVYKHQQLARMALQAAAVYAASGGAVEAPGYAELSKKLIVDYAAQYPLYPVHPDAQPWMLKGRAFHQALTEAIWATTLIRAYLLLSDEGVSFSEDEKEKLAVFFELMEGSMSAYRHILIHERRNPENNYTAWLNAALACVYAAQGEREKLAELVQAEGGFIDHLSIGVKPDQFEFEATTYYHVFVLRAYLIFAEMAERCGVSLYEAVGAQGQSLRGMLSLLAALADDQGVLPALHDGPLERRPYAREIAEVAEQGLAIYGLRELAPVLGEAYRQLGALPGSRTGLEALLYGDSAELAAFPPDTELLQGVRSSKLLQGVRSSKLLAESGFVIGRHRANPLAYLADFGEHGGAHGHRDKLHVSLMHAAGVLAPDQGVTPYGSSLRPWYGETACHNTVSLNGQSQAEHTGRCVQFSCGEQGTYVWLQSEDAYPALAGCRLDRHLLLTADWLLDWFEVTLEAEAGDEASMEWWLHPLVPPVSAQLREAPQISISVPFGESELALPVTGSFAPEAGQVHVRYSLPSGETVWHTAGVMPGQELLTVLTPGHSVDPSVPLTAVLHRERGRRARFVHVYRAGAEPAALRFEEDLLNVSVQNSTTTVAWSETGGLLIVSR
ncbi:heparinase II/III domain-containing protein [Paenibacillus ferrarius]|uniref:heparinase II/III domain-containing protein n=1 Tax=Paenibacillus ferrarius TaxID=1469647 RepID=UPI003D2D9322